MANLSDDAARVQRPVPTVWPWTMSAAWSLWCGVMGALVARSWMHDPAPEVQAGVGMAAFAFVVVVLESARTLAWRRVARARAAAASAAERALLVPEPKPLSFAAQAVNAAEYVAEVGPRGPRVIVVAMPIDLPLAAPSGEPADLGGSRRALPMRRRLAAFAAAVFLFIGLLAVAGPAGGWILAARLQPAGDLPTWSSALALIGFSAAMALVYAGVVGATLAQAGLLPIWPWGAVATPGRVEFYGVGRGCRFTRVDSVLVLRRGRTWLRDEGLGRHAIHARFARADGSTRAIRFSDGFSDPALQDLLAHWCREDCSAEPPDAGDATSSRTDEAPPHDHRRAE